MTKKKKHWIFDMDGTLTVSIHDFPAIKTELNLPHHLDILSGLRLLPEKEAEIKRIRLNEIELKLAHSSLVAEGTFSLLNQLKARNFSLGVLTRNNYVNTVATLNACGLDLFFKEENILTRDHAEPKPHPEGIFFLLNKWRAEKEESMMVGDYLYDLQTGIAAGIDTVYIDPSGVFEFSEYATHSIRSLDEILNLNLF